VVVEIAWLSPDGAGAARGPTGIVQVPGGVPGDVLEVRTVRQQGSTVHAEMIGVVTPSPDRQVPPCPWSTACGGCDLDALTYPGQLKAKAEIVRHALRLDRPVSIVPSPRPSQYRARIRLEVREGRAGFHGVRSHALVEIAECGLVRPEVAEGIQKVRGWLSTSASVGLTHVEIRSDGSRVVYAWESSGEVPRATRDALPALGDVALDGRKLAGEPTLSLEVAGATLRASPKSFFQVNLEINQALVQVVLDAVAAVSPERVLDLYAGIGNFGLPIARKLRVPVLAVEREGQSMEDLKASAHLAGVSLLRTLAMPVEKFDTSREPFDLVVLDPPRAGAPGVIPRLLAARPRRLIYVACNPPHAVRDLKAAFDAGYTLTQVQAFDQFPDTHHVEAVFVLDRGAKGPPKKGAR
jgi:23S rRNA (uracil1939-C5)-methyltransferase